MVYVQVLDRDGNSLSVGSSHNGVFGSINEAVNAVSKDVGSASAYSGYYFKVKLCGKLFDEYVVIPSDLKLEFVTDSKQKSVIRAVKSENSYVTFSSDIEIKKVVDSWIFLNDDGSKMVIPNEKVRVSVYQQIKESNPDLITSSLTKAFIKGYKGFQNDLTRMILLLEDKTMNIQLLGVTGSLKEDLLFIDKGLNELNIVLSEADGNEMYKLQETGEYQKLVQESIYNPKQRIESLNSFIEAKGFLKNPDLFNNVDENATKGNIPYLNFISEIVFMIQELLYAYNYFLKKVIVTLNSVDNDSYSAHRLMFIEELFKEVLVKFKVLNVYVHDIGDENAVLAKGENSSVVILELAEQGLKSPNRNKCKRVLVTFLNKHAKTTLTLDSTNEDVITALRNYSKGYPDADYCLVRFMKSHARGFAVYTGVLTLLGIVSPLSTIIKYFPTKFS